MKTHILIAASLLVLAGCSSTGEGSKVDYKSQGRIGPSLEVPPDLTQLTKSAQANVPVGGAANASSFQTATPTVATAPTSRAVSTVAGVAVLADIRVERDGTQRWLVVNRPPERLWDELKGFWKDNGFTLEVDQPNIGIMETEWNENRAKLPQDGLRKLIGKVIDGLYSTHERDKFRTRLERTASGGTEIYISHRGMSEDFVDKEKARLQWKSRPIDPELEVEFLKRLMVRLGGEPEAAKAALDKPALQSRAKMATEGGQSSLVLNDAFEQAWRRVGLSLDRNNFTVEDRDRSKGIYFVRFVNADAEKDAPGFFARMFGAKAKEGLQKYQILVKAESSTTRVQVAAADGQLATTEDAKSILKVLSDDLK